MPALGPSTRWHRKKARKAAHWFTLRLGRSKTPRIGKQAPADQPIGALGFRMGGCSNLCVPVYPTGTHFREIPLKQGFRQENVAWTAALACFGHGLASHGGLDQHRLPLGLAGYGLRAKRIFSSISDLGPKRFLGSGERYRELLGV